VTNQSHRTVATDTRVPVCDGGELAGAREQLAALQERERELLAEAAEAEASIAAIRASSAWRLLQVLLRLRAWCRSAAAKAGWRLHHLSRHGARRVPNAVRDAPLGVNVAGYLATESGMGEAARASIRSLAASAVPVTLNLVPSFLREQDTSCTGFVDENPHPFNLVHLNCDNMAAFRAARGAAYFRHRYTIGYWFWELSQFRHEWLSTFQYVDEVWVASEFGRQALLPHAPVPVVRMPLPVTLGPIVPFARSRVGLDDRTAMFLFAFDVSSQFERKNPIGVIRAFREAGFGRHDAALVLKFTNPEYDPDAVRLLRAESDGLPIVLLDGYMERAELTGLIAACDCYVSLHRAEGFGLSMAEAMRLGKPVIATAYSGNLDFMTEENSYLVPADIVPIARDHGPYPAGFEWADPDVTHAAQLMRRIVDDPSDAARVGRRAAADMIARRDPSITGAAVRARLEAIRDGKLWPVG
jgi:glycosyltransferase involved in cell wall biosynthesis